MKRFSAAAWIFLGYTILVILWGAFVRATGSGAGCGAHWPLCNGEVLPQDPQIHTLIEFTHRATSGLCLLGVLWLWAWGRRLFEKGTLVRVSALVSVAFMLTEAAIGAGLVLLRLVAQDTSMLRAVYLSVHLVNTFLLLTALTALAWASHRPSLRWAEWRIVDPLKTFGLFALATCLMITGGIAALGDTLFPSTTFREGFASDFAEGAHFLLRLRVLHPFLAIFFALATVFFTLDVYTRTNNVRIRRGVQIVWGILAAQMIIGLWNLAWLAPVFLQILHLFMADLLWVALILLVLDRADDRISLSRNHSA